jgi:uncharacterized protein
MFIGALMLKIKTYLDKDSWGGTGIFAGEDVPKGEAVWAYHPDFTMFISIEEYFAAKGAWRAELEKYAYPSTHPRDASRMGLLLNMDNSRYMNHADDPNTGAAEFMPAGQIIDVALRPIRKGEELTSNYLTYDPENFVHNCGVVTSLMFLYQKNAAIL